MSFYINVRVCLLHGNCKCYSRYTLFHILHYIKLSYKNKMTLHSRKLFFLKLREIALAFNIINRTFLLTSNHSSQIEALHY